MNFLVRKAIEGEYRIGKHGIGERDENGNRLAGLLSTARLFHGNSFFQKKERLRWTWKSPDDTVHAEIDHFLTNRRWCLFDVSVLPAFPSESGHRLLRAKVRLSKTLEEEWLKRKKKVNDENIPDDVLQQLVCHVEEKLSYNSKHVDEEI
ncbi:hypothetical protein DICVIV_01445 [Dictyocaulus viviparus]|uniref:Endonuclease/exonuclease/phosphatase domain-containing protein n=1 Tax=Dictyocaulus viviparus TaxID=29172 RepID=A0A0D8Y675_DICVI|nr:hypothetical protein DICVIV_01445 [Dictyocaulus viviparus]